MNERMLIKKNLLELEDEGLLQKKNNWSKSGFAVVKIKYLKSFQLREFRHKLRARRREGKTVRQKQEKREIRPGKIS